MKSLKTFSSLISITSLISFTCATKKTVSLRHSHNPKQLSKQPRSIIQSGDYSSLESQSENWHFISTCDFDLSLKDVPPYYVSPLGTDAYKFGLSPEKPYRTIQYAVNRRRKCQTIYVMEGTYRNPHYGLGKFNQPVVKLNGVKDLKITSHKIDKVVLEFDGYGGITGGSKNKPISNVEITGMEIIGPNAGITYKEALDHRLARSTKYRGRGIAIWAGHNIYIHDMIVHHCPGSGIRINRGDYIVIANNIVYSNTWWNSAAESAIVLAQSVAIDESDEVKMSIVGNEVYDNVNKIPYYNPNYSWDYSPIAEGLDCTSYSSCRSLQIKGCPWQCRYGKISQDYIIDGSGVYVTRNTDTYHHGRMELNDNISYKNGINGLVVHRTDRVTVRRNVIYKNGVVPRSEHAEPVVEDWHEGCRGESRQPYSGLIMNNAVGVELINNAVSARYDDDYAYKQVGVSEPLLGRRGDNTICMGMVDIIPSEVVASVCEPTSAPSMLPIISTYSALLYSPTVTPVNNAAEVNALPQSLKVVQKDTMSVSISHSLPVTQPSNDDNGEIAKRSQRSRRKRHLRD